MGYSHRTAKSLTQLNTLAIHVEGREVSGVSLYKGTNPNMSAQHSWPHLILITSKDVMSKYHCICSLGLLWMLESDHKEGWELKNWCFQTVVLERTLESPLNSKEIKAVNPKGNQPWILIGSTDAEALILATWCKQGTHWKSPWCWERLKAGEGDIGWDGWMAWPTQWMWVWANSGR